MTIQPPRPAGLGVTAEHVPGHLANPRSERGRAYGAAQRAVLSRESAEAARREISAWPGYAPTALVELPGLAAAAGVARVAAKDEGGRFGLGSFKALGGAYAVLRRLKERIEAETGAQPPTDALLAGRFADIAREMTVCCATDGNHGRSVAWGARMFGLDCVIYIHENVSRGREAAIARFGAEVRRVEGTYDDSVRRAAEDAAKNGWFAVSDTYCEGDGDMDPPRDVMAGYTVMAAEALAQWGAPPPSHVFVQAGVGGLAAAVCGYNWETLGARRPRLVVVEPDKAACLFASARRGRAAAIEGDCDTVMAGLAAGEPSLLAWDILGPGADDFLTVPDETAPACMRLLAEGTAGDPPLVAGESAVAGLAGFLGARGRPALAEALHLGPRSRVLLFLTEGDTDPELYQRLVGRPAAAVRGRR
ncbi:MAG: diaminopropionate ammonia-lyase [Kiloniellaceae bacterium]